jgi:hypothetical protein
VDRDVEAAGRAILEAIPERVRERYRRRAMEAPTSYRAAVFLKCLECQGWEYKEAQRCHQVLCALWEIRTRLFTPYRGKKAKLRVVK